VTCHPAEVTFPPLPQTIKAGTRFNDPEGCRAELTYRWLGYMLRWCVRLKAIRNGTYLDSWRKRVPEEL